MCVYVYVHVCMCVYICVCVRVFVCVLYVGLLWFDAIVSQTSLFQLNQSFLGTTFPHLWMLKIRSWMVTSRKSCGFLVRNEILQSIMDLVWNSRKAPRFISLIALMWLPPDAMVAWLWLPKFLISKCKGLFLLVFKN